MDIALACDFIFAAPGASFAASFIKRGLIPDGGSLHYLPRRIGLQNAKDLLFTGRTVDIAEAQSMGLIDVLAQDEGEFLPQAIAYAGRFAAQPGPSLMLTKSILNQSFELSLPQTAALGAQAQAICYTTDEHRESVEEILAAMNAKREPKQQ
jgi:enoyl-CoA hydratase/carnithine racemase